MEKVRKGEFYWSLKEEIIKLAQTRLCSPVVPNEKRLFKFYVTR